jgi:hypothetical protein
VLAVDNAAMAGLDQYSLPTVRHILSLHVLVDYYGAKKLRGLSNGATASASMFQVYRVTDTLCSFGAFIITKILHTYKL